MTSFCASRRTAAAITLTIATALTLGAVACKHDETQLSRSVQGYCYTLETQLKDAADRYRKVAPALDANQFTPEQQQRAEADLRMNSVGVSVDARYARAWDYSQRLDFCANVHRIDAKHLDDITVRIQSIREALEPAVASGRMPTAAETADLLDKFYALAHEVNAAPLKE